LVDGEELAMGYLYEAMNRAKDAIQFSYYGDKGNLGYEKYLRIKDLIDE